MVNGPITRFSDIEDIRTLRPGDVDFDAMTDGDLALLGTLARNHLQYDSGGGNLVEGWPETGAVVFGVLTTGREPGDIVRSLGAVLNRMSEIVELGGDQEDRAARLALLDFEAEYELGTRTPSRPSGHVDLPARNYDGDTRNDIAVNPNWDGSLPEFETIGDRLRASSRVEP